MRLDFVDNVDSDCVKHLVIAKILWKPDFSKVHLELGGVQAKEAFVQLKKQGKEKRVNVILGTGGYEELLYLGDRHGFFR